MAKRIGVLLAGSDSLDGSEIQEAALTLYFLDKAGAEIVCMAPNIPHLHVVDHVAGGPVTETRNVLVESARIARGQAEVGAGVEKRVIPPLKANR